MEALKEAYLELYPEADLGLQISDSSTGINDVINGISQIGMSSRSLKDSELESGLTAVTIAMDGISVIVNKNNELDGLTKDQVKKIYTGEITKWNEIN
jgi:phosphate transport system substrate-binding protein